MTTPWGPVMSVAMTNCGDAGWLTDRNGYRYEYGYDGDGRCVRGDGSGQALSGTYRYDPEAQVTTWTDVAGAVTRYEISDGARVAAITGPLGHRTCWEHDARGQVVIAAQGIQAGAVLIVLTDVLVSHEFGQRAPAKCLQVAGCHTEPKVWYTSERLAVDRAADRLVLDVDVNIATLVVLIFFVYVIGIDRDLEGLEGFDISVHPRAHGANEPYSFGLRAIDFRRPNLLVL